VKLLAKVSFLGFITLLSVIYTVPTFFPNCAKHPIFKYFNAQPTPLGLDLKGGASVLLEVDLESANKSYLQRLAQSTRQFLRAEKVSAKFIQIQGNSLLIGSEKSFADSVQKALGRGIHITYDEQQSCFVATPSGAIFEEQQSMLVEQSIGIVGRRIDESGTKEANILRQGFNRFLVQVPGLADTTHLLSLIGRTAQLNFHLFASKSSAFGSLKIPDANQKNTMYSLQPLPDVAGDMLVDAQPSFDDNGQPAVSFRLNAIGARKFGEVTKKNIGKPFAIVLDKKVISAPVIQSAITGGSGIISGHFTTAEARQLAILLRSGALPADLKILEESTVGPDLGSDSITLGKNATLVSIAILFIFVWVVYGALFGTVANASLALNLSLLISVMSILEATLTLPGIAGIALTLGMAVDANVLIYERIKEELALGNTLQKSLKAGFKRAIATIVDSNVTTLLGAFFLYQFGSGPVRGFAISLSLGIILSMFTAITLTRIMLQIALRNKSC